MQLKTLRFRQVHLDFHTSPHIRGIGTRFEKKQWQKTLREAAVDSITLFAKCHHGWSYYDTKAGRKHPHLDFDLLRAQYEACKEIDVQAPIYISAGLDDVMAHEHPEWRPVLPDGQLGGWSAGPLHPGFKLMDWHSPYLSYLCEQIEEVVTLFPDCDGIFLDIIHAAPSVSRWSLGYMESHGLDPLNPEDVAKAGEDGLALYYQMSTASARKIRAEMPVFHNSGHIARGRHDVLGYQSHLELESLPTGGWGYDHFPLSAMYAANLPHEYLGMTGKFHTTWGEFGGYKHPNALRYECAAMLAFGAKCSVGDQLPPDSRLDESTYAIIGHAYREVAAKEAWCQKVTPVAEIAVLSSESEHPGETRNSMADEGACRILLEGHFLFSVIDRTMPFEGYRIVILPDTIRLDGELQKKLRSFLRKGGQVLLSGESGLLKDDDSFGLPIGAAYEGPSPYEPDYILPASAYRPDFVASPLVMYQRSQRIRVRQGESLGDVYDPWFNRTYQHYCSHQHTPPADVPSGFACGVRHKGVVYLAHPVFTLYRGMGAVAYRHYVTKILESMLEGERILRTTLPSTARATLMHQPGNHRHVLHLLYANTIHRGGALAESAGSFATSRPVEVIEELLPLHDVECVVRLPSRPIRVSLEPEGREIPFEKTKNGWCIRLEKLLCHQMVVFQER